MVRMIYHNAIMKINVLDIYILLLVIDEALNHWWVKWMLDNCFYDTLMWFQLMKDAASMHWAIVRWKWHFKSSKLFRTTTQSILNNFNEAHGLRCHG